MDTDNLLRTDRRRCTDRQRRYLSLLAQAAGRSIPRPADLTIPQASELIKELKREIPRNDLPTNRPLQRDAALGTAPRAEDAPRSDYPGRDDAPRGDGKRQLLATYELDGHERQIVGQTTHGDHRRIWDQGLSGPETTLIASNYRGRSLTELQELIAKYTERAIEQYAATGRLPQLQGA